MSIPSIRPLAARPTERRRRARDAGASPAFTPFVLRPRRSRFCVLVTVIDEGPRLARQLARMRPQMRAIDVIVCDGGSSDGSTERNRMQAAGVRTALISAERERFSASLRIGFAYALCEGYDGVITVDGNDKDGVEAIPRFVEKLEQGFDFVQGSRFLPGGAHLRTPRHRQLAIRLLHAPVVRRMSGFPYTDTTNGFRAHSARLLRDPRLQLFRPVFDGYELPAYVSVRAPRLGLRVTELPVARHYPPGEVPTKIPRIRGPIELLWVLARVAQGRLDPPAPTRGRRDSNLPEPVDRSSLSVVARRRRGESGQSSRRGDPNSICGFVFLTRVRPDERPSTSRAPMGWLLCGRRLTGRLRKFV